MSETSGHQYKCDVCDGEMFEENNGIEQRLPDEWYLLEWAGAPHSAGSITHFCSLRCLVKHVSET